MTTLADKHWEKWIPEPNSGCWLWLGALYHHNYGAVRHEGRARNAYRVFCEDVKGQCPQGLVVSHKCENSYCVNPDHMIYETQSENNGRRKKLGNIRAPKGRSKRWAFHLTRPYHYASFATREEAVEYARRFREERGYLRNAQRERDPAGDS